MLLVIWNIQMLLWTVRVSLSSCWAHTASLSTSLPQQGHCHYSPASDVYWNRRAKSWTMQGHFQLLSMTVLYRQYGLSWRWWLSRRKCLALSKVKYWHALGDCSQRCITALWLLLMGFWWAVGRWDSWPSVYLSLYLPTSWLQSCFTAKCLLVISL